MLILIVIGLRMNQHFVKNKIFLVWCTSVHFHCCLHFVCFFSLKLLTFRCVLFWTGCFTTKLLLFKVHLVEYCCICNQTHLHVVFVVTAVYEFVLSYIFHYIVHYTYIYICVQPKLSAYVTFSVLNMPMWYLWLLQHAFYIIFSCSENTAFCVVYSLLEQAW